MPGLLVLDPADLCEAACESRRGVHSFGQWAGTIGQGGGRAMLVPAEVHPEADAGHLAVSERRQKFVPKRGAERCLEAWGDPQPGQDRLAAARIRRRREKPPQPLRLSREPRQPRIDLACRIERRLLTGKSVYHRCLSRFDDGAALLDPVLGFGHGRRGSGHRLRRNQCGGQHRTLPLRLGAPCLQPVAAFSEILATPFERDAARVHRRDGFSLPLQRRFRLGQARSRLAQPQPRSARGRDHPPPRPG